MGKWTCTSVYKRNVRVQLVTCTFLRMWEVLACLQNCKFTVQFTRSSSVSGCWVLTHPWADLHPPLHLRVWRGGGRGQVTPLLQPPFHPLHLILDKATSTLPPPPFLSLFNYPLTNRDHLLQSTVETNNMFLSFRSNGSRRHTKFSRKICRQEMQKINIRFEQIFVCFNSIFSKWISSLPII